MSIQYWPRNLRIIASTAHRRGANTTLSSTRRVCDLMPQLTSTNHRLCVGPACTAISRRLDEQSDLDESGLNWCRVSWDWNLREANAEMCCYCMHLHTTMTTVTHCTTKHSTLTICIMGWAKMASVPGSLTPVSYTHLTLPTNREV